MSEDDIVRQLGRAAREAKAAEEGDDRWERLARGALPPQEIAAIRKEAETDPETAAMYEAFRPLEASVNAAIAARAAAELRGGQVIRPARWWRVASVAAPLVAAAAVALWIARPGSGVGGEIPSYALSVRGGDRDTRAAGNDTSTGVVEVRPDSRLELVLRPEHRVVGEVGVRTFLARDGDVRAWSPSLELSPDGAFHLAGPAGALLGVSPGTWDVLLVTGRPASLPDAPAVAAALREPSARHPWQLLAARVHVVPAQ
jgi:hypothetical protein